MSVLSPKRYRPRLAEELSWHHIEAERGCTRIAASPGIRAGAKACCVRSRIFPWKPPQSSIPKEGRLWQIRNSVYASSARPRQASDQVDRPDETNVGC